MKRRPALIVLLAAALAAAGCGGGEGDETGAPATRSSERDDAQLTDLTSVEQLRSRFNADRGTPRLILLLAPT